MRRKEYVERPEYSHIEAFVLIDEPDTIYINLSCKRKGITLIVPLSQPATTKDEVV